MVGWPSDIACIKASDGRATAMAGTPGATRLAARRRSSGGAARSEAAAVKTKMRGGRRERGDHLVDRLVPHDPDDHRQPAAVHVS